MPRSPSTIVEGDLVVVYFSRDSINSLIVEPGKALNTRYGVYKHAEMVGRPFGSKMPSSNGKGFTYLLKPTPELWTLALMHRTQILYQPDIAFITSYLNIIPGKIVIEAGTGSGSFSHAVARNIGADGHLYSFEFHQERFEQARDEFAAHKLTQIHIQHRNVCKDGFGDELQGKADALFLDVPSPWQAIDFAKDALRTDVATRICCFSPCIEQVIRTVTSLTASGFTDITMYEALVRNYDSVPIASETETVQQAIERLQTVEVRKEQRRQRQMKRAKEANLAKANAPGDIGEARQSSTVCTVPNSPVDATLKIENAGDAPGLSQPSEAQAAPEEGRAAKRQKLDDAAEQKPNDPPEEKETSKDETQARPPILSRRQIKASLPSMARALPQQRGHTSYLTFATLLPSMALSSNGTEATRKTQVDDLRTKTPETLN